MQNIQVIHLWQLDLTILTAQIFRSSVERTGVCGCQSAFIALIANDSNSKHTRKTLTDFGLTGSSLRHSNRHKKHFVGRSKKWHAIVRSRTVTWLTRWRLLQWSQLNSRIFFLSNPTRKDATMLDGINNLIIIIKSEVSIFPIAAWNGCVIIFCQLLQIDLGKVIFHYSGVYNVSKLQGTSFPEDHSISFAHFAIILSSLCRLF